MGNQEQSKLKKAADSNSNQPPEDDDDLNIEDEELEGDEEEEAEGGEEEGSGKSIEELEEELERTRIALKKANRESAKRRLELKELKKTPEPKPEGSGEEDKEGEKLQKEIDRLNQELAGIRSENATLKLRGTIRSKAAALKLSFFSEEALEDAVGRVQTILGEDEYDDEDIGAAIKDVAKSRPYLFRKAEKQAEGENGSSGGGGTDAAKKGASDVIVTEDEEKEVARRFNIKS
jgi:hypothetical protein